MAIKDKKDTDQNIAKLGTPSTEQGSHLPQEPTHSIEPKDEQQDSTNLLPNQDDTKNRLVSDRTNLEVADQTEPTGPPPLSSNPKSESDNANGSLADVGYAKRDTSSEQQAPTQANSDEAKKLIQSGATANSDSLVPPDDLLDKAVDDIVATESDELLAVKDNINQGYTPALATKKSFKNIIIRWWRNKKLRYITLGLIFVTILTLFLVPNTRYAIINATGARAGLSVKIIDAKYGLPIKNVDVTVGDKRGTTDTDGRVVLRDVRLGKTKLVLAKRSFAPKSVDIVVGWGSNPFVDPIQLDATGSSYEFVVTDWLSNKPISKVEISDGDSKVLTDDQGKVSMLLQSEDQDIRFSIKAAGYRTENIVVGPNDKDQQMIKLVVANPDVFVSKRSGKYDVYRKDVDGANEIVLLGGTGSEQEGIGLLSSQNGAVVAVASTRDGKRDRDGYLLNNLYTIDIETKTVIKIPDTEAAQIQLIDWVGDKLVFVKIASAASAAISARQTLVSYDYKQEKSTTIAAANYFNDVEVINGQIYFAQNSTGGVAQLVRVNPDNSAKTVLLNQEVWQLVRPKHGRIQANAADKNWYDQQIGDLQMALATTPLGAPQNRLYIDSPNADKSVWVDERDGKGVLLLEDVKTGESKITYSKGGLGYPVRWLSDKHILLRISNSQETADYVFNIDGGELVKVTDVTKTASNHQWYYR